MLPEVGLSKSQFVDFARRLGEPVLPKVVPDYPEILVLCNVDGVEDKPVTNASHWHTDQSFRANVASMTMLHTLHVPAEGGETQICDLVAAYDALSESTKCELENLIVLHKFGAGIAPPRGDHAPAPAKGIEHDDPPVSHPLVRPHPVTGKKALYAIAGTASGIEGMSQEEAAELLRGLCEHALQPCFITKRKHRADDLFIWDCAATLHRAEPIDAAKDLATLRLIDRISVGGLPSVFADRRYSPILKRRLDI